jgi:hypothetical protein
VNQMERFKKSGELEFQIYDSVNMLEQGIELLNKAAWYCREVGNVYDSNRNKNLNDDVFITLEKIKELHNYWSNVYDEMENDDFE